MKTMKIFLPLNFPHPLRLVHQWIMKSWRHWIQIQGTNHVERTFKFLLKLTKRIHMNFNAITNATISFSPMTVKTLNAAWNVMRKSEIPLKTMDTWWEFSYAEKRDFSINVVDFSFQMFVLFHRLKFASCKANYFDVDF